MRLACRGCTPQRYPRKSAQTDRARPRPTRFPTCSSPRSYRVPFQFSRYGASGSTCEWAAPSCKAHRRRADRPTSTATGFYDLTGSYGVNVFGYDFYKVCIEEAVRDCGCANWGRCWALITRWSRSNAERLAEANLGDGRGVVSHVRHRGGDAGGAPGALPYRARRNLVRFCGAYHGWWERRAAWGRAIRNRHATPTPCEDMDDAALGVHVLRTRRDIACVLINPLQALHPNAGAPGDSSLVDSSRRAALRSRAAYAAWLKRRTRRSARRTRHRPDFRRSVRRLSPCTAAAPRSTSAWRADMVTYGKTRWAVACRSASSAASTTWMKRFREDRPADICFARGTFNSHPYVMGAMAEFLDRLETPAKYAKFTPGPRPNVWTRTRRTSSTARLDAAGATAGAASPTCPRSGPCSTPSPAATTGCCSTICGPQGLALSWVGTGRLIFSLNYDRCRIRRGLPTVLSPPAKAMQNVTAGGGAMNDAVQQVDPAREFCAN